jgi:hypothetical protein
MARKSRRSSSRKMKRTHRRKTHHRRRHTRRGGSMLAGAPVNYHLSGSWPSRMSLGQGADYFKYHQGQHGGAAPFPSSIGMTLPAAMRGPAHIGGIDKAFIDVAGLRDPPYAGGGMRRKGRKGSKRHHSKRRHSRKHRMTHRRRRGGSLGYAPFPSKGMLLSGSEYAQAGLNPGWKTDVAFKAAEVRQGQ